MKYPILFSGKNRENITNLSPVELAGECKRLNCCMGCVMQKGPHYVVTKAKI